MLKQITKLIKITTKGINIQQVFYGETKAFA